MKSKLLILSVLLVGASALLTSFKNKEVKPAATGGLTVKIKLPVAGDLADAWIGLATSAENLENMKYVKTIATDKAGIADFGQLEPGTYYIDGGTGEEVFYYGEAEVVIVAGKNTVVELNLTADTDDEEMEDDSEE